MATQDTPTKLKNYILVKSIRNESKALYKHKSGSNWELAGVYNMDNTLKESSENATWQTWLWVVTNDIIEAWESSPCRVKRLTKQEMFLELL